MVLHGMKLSLRSYGEILVTHAHDFHQIVLPVTGTIDTQVGAIAGSISSRNLAVIGRGASHSFRAFGFNRFVVLDTDRPVAGAGPVFRALDATLAELVCYAGAELASGDLCAETEFHLTALLAARLRSFYGAAVCDRGPVERSLTAMAARYAENLTVANLADIAGLRPSQFHVAFRRKTGKSPADMLADIRLDRACSMLWGTTLPIAEIALAVGFSDQTALTRCFRRRRATTPGAIRRQRTL